MSEQQDTLPEASLWNVERQRRLRILRIVSLSAIFSNVAYLSSILTLMPVTTAGRPSLLIAMGSLLVIEVGTWQLARLGQLELGTHLLAVAVIILMTLAGLTRGINSTAPYVLFVPIVGSTLLLAPRWTFVYAGLSVVSATLMYVFGPDPVQISTLVIRMISFASYYGLVALLAFLAAQGYARLVDVLLRRTAELQEIQTSLEDRVRERTHEMQAALENVQRSSELIRQLSVPVLPVAEGVLVLPLIGAIDPQRARLISEQLLGQVHQQRARTVIIDLTAIGEVDTFVASALLELIGALRLLGSEPVLVGIRAEIARVMVELGLMLGNVVTRRDLRSGLAYAMGAESASLN